MGQVVRVGGWVVVVVVLFLSCCQGYEDYRPQEQDLRQQLLKDYDRTSLPARTTQLRLRRFTIKHLDIEEEKHLVDIDAWLIYEWTDSRLEYIPTSGIEKLSMSTGEIWMPDLRLYNSASTEDNKHLDDTLTLVYPDGRVLYAPPVKLRASCVVDVTYWPHDQHNCSLVFGSWVHHGHTIDLRLLDKEAKVDVPKREEGPGGTLSRSEWQIVEAKITRRENSYNCCPEPYVSLWVTLILTRDAPAFSWLVKIPVAGLSLLTVVLFLLPPGAGEKLVFGGLCLILDVLFIAYTSSVVSHAPSHTPLIVQLVCEQVVLVVSALVVSGLVIRLVHHPHSAGLPYGLRRPLVRVAACLFLSDYNNLVEGFQRSLPHSLKSEDLELGGTGGVAVTGGTGVGGKQEMVVRNEWVFLAAVVDRICLLLYLFLCLVNFIRFHAVL